MLGKKLTQRELYERLYSEHKLFQETVYKVDEDTASRRANIFAVKNTVYLWRKQYVWKER